MILVTLTEYHMVALNHQSFQFQGSNPLFWPLWTYHTYDAHTFVLANTHAYKPKINLRFRCSIAHL